MNSYDAIVGTSLAGIFFNTFLYGLVTCQFAAYHLTKFNDPPTTRRMVFFLFLLDTIHSVSLIYAAWRIFVTNHDNPTAHAGFGLPFSLTPLATALAGLVTHIYLGSRIWRLTSSRTLYSVVILLAIPSFVLGMTSSIVSSIVNFSELSRFHPLAISFPSMQATADIFITTTLIIVFSRSRTGMGPTDRIINRFIRGAIQTGLFASLFSLCSFITFVVSGDPSFLSVFGIPTGRIYTNTLMDILLTRRRLMVKTDSAETVTPGPRIDPTVPTSTEAQTISMA